MANLTQRDLYYDMDRVKSSLCEKDRSFAQDLLRGFGKYGSWTEKQLYWVRTLIARVDQPAAPAEQVVADLAPIVQLFDTARQHLKYPFLLMATASHRTLRLSIAGPNSRNAGDLYIAGEGGWGSRAYYGRIDKAGCFHAGRDGHDCQPELKAALSRFAADPAGEAARYGKMHGHCCFCNIALTDDRSLEVGHGPVCAKHFGLPWGKKAIAPAPLLECVA